MEIRSPDQWKSDLLIDKSWRAKMKIRSFDWWKADLQIELEPRRTEIKIRSLDWSKFDLWIEIIFPLTIRSIQSYIGSRVPISRSRLSFSIDNPIYSKLHRMKSTNLRIKICCWQSKATSDNRYRSPDQVYVNLVFGSNEYIQKPRSNNNLKIEIKFWGSDKNPIYSRPYQTKVHLNLNFKSVINWWGFLC